MKKNRYLAMLLALILALTMLGGCGASSGDNGVAGEMAADAATEAMPEEAAEAPAEAPEPMMMETAESDALPPDGVVTGETTGNLAEKIIYSAYAEVETTEFEESVDAVYDLLDQYGAFLENSSVTGSNISDTVYGSQSNRSASFTMRVPKENYGAMTAALDTVGNVTYLTNDAQNITAQYTDTESRLKAYETEEARLLEIMAQAETVEDMISLESRLSEIRYEKENLTAQLKNWDNQVDYSSVSICLNEVQVLTPEPQEDPTYGQELKEAFLGSIRFMGRACKALLKLFVEVIPVLLPLAALVLIVVLICVKVKRKKEKKQDPKQDATPPEP